MEAARGLLVIGPLAVGKTTLLRDIARIRREQRLRRLFVVDSSNEITGDGPDTHAMLAGIGLLKVGDPGQQAAQFHNAFRTHEAMEVLSDELGYNQDVELALTAARLGITVIATVHGTRLSDVLTSPLLFALLGVSRHEQGRPAKHAQACFDTAVEVVAKGRYRVYPGLDEVAERMLAKEQVEGIRVGDWPGEWAQAAD